MQFDEALNNKKFSLIFLILEYNAFFKNPNIMDQKSSMNIPKIYHGPENVGAIGRYLADWQRSKKGAIADFIVYEDNTNRKISHKNLHLERENFFKRNILKLEFFFSAWRNYDIFHFYFGKTLLPLYLDLPILRLSGKIIFMHYLGSDIRLYKLHSKINPYYKLRKSKNLWDHFDLAKRIRMRWQSLWFHLCFAEKNIYQDALTSIPKSKIVKDLWLSTTLDVPKSPPVFKEKDRVLIIHAPTNPLTKGTKYVEQAISALKEEGLEFDFRIYHKVPHDEFIKVLIDEADIIVDQLLGGGFGTLAMEGMCYGKPVCGYITDELRSAYPDLPIVQCTVETLKDVLKDLILNAEKRKKIALEGWEFAKKHYDRDPIYEDVWNIYMDLWETKNRKLFAS